MLNVDEMSTTPELVFMGQNNLIGSADNSPTQATTHVNAHMLKDITSDNDTMMLFMDAVKILNSDRLMTTLFESLKLSKKLVL